jgi:general stress protein YciG
MTAQHKTPHEDAKPTKSAASHEDTKHTKSAAGHEDTKHAKSTAGHEDAKHTKAAASHADAKDTKSAASPKGEAHSQVGAGKGKDSNNFANDHAKASEAGKKGGHSSH